MRSNLLAVTLLGLLAACAPDAPVEDSAVNDPAGAAPSTSSAPPAATYPADHVIDAPVPENELDYAITLESGPGYRAGGDVLVFRVGVENTGLAALVGEGEQPVNVGAYAVAAGDGADASKAPRDGAVRTKLPLLVPGEKVVVDVRMPAADLVGQAVRAELVQERVAWMGRRYGKPVLDVGAFQRCGGAEKTLCDASGTPLPSM